MRLLMWNWGRYMLLSKMFKAYILTTTSEIWFQMLALSMLMSNLPCKWASREHTVSMGHHEPLTNSKKWFQVFKVTSLLLAPYASPSLARFRPWRLGTRKKKRNHCVRSTPAKLQIPPLTWHRPMPSLIAGWPSLISPTMASAAKASGIWFTTAVNFHPFRLVYRARTLAASLRELMLACSLLASQGRACCNSYLVSIQDNPIRATSEHLPQTTGPIDPSTHKTGWRRASTAGPFGSSHAGPWGW